MRLDGLEKVRRCVFWYGDVGVVPTGTGTWTGVYGGVCASCRRFRIIFTQHTARASPCRHQLWIHRRESFQLICLDRLREAIMLPYLGRGREG